MAEKAEKMVAGLLGKKIGMTRIFLDGIDTPVTVIKAGECYVTQKKVREKDGYDSLQLGFAEKRKDRTTKPLLGHFEKAATACFYKTKEFRGEGLDGYRQGQKITVSEVFKVGDIVDVSGVSKGKGFAGVMKRWHFSGGPKSHGASPTRAPGSIGSSSYPSRVFKGMRMGGHMGARNTTVENLRVVGIKETENILMVKGAVPGAVNGFIVIKKAAKKG
uniref:Large ribosomal subunit protein uL3 n=1 Tax=uncultured delta proteobacterium Rifle_16ft_4_minimus_10129 TaxID=1665172 RepID=A0A0H4T2V2_9DELT|nr:50S ribosomal protein L3, large subunit ribosomal protein L3 [uncultured delta proteobacterium Rifle_16ft_4_minimus_10129]